MGKPFEQIRKRGKLPGQTRGVEYGLEYRENDTIEMIDDGFIRHKRVLLIDDVLATGGTARAGCTLVEQLGGTVIGFTAIVELPFLGGRGVLGDYPVHTILSIIDGRPVRDVTYCVDILVEHPDHEHACVLVKRLTEPHGTALPGGHIEKHEPAVATVVRELSEETGYDIAYTPEFLETLCGLSRDPRGVKVSLLYRVHAHGVPHSGEANRTIVRHLTHETLSTMDPSEFVFDAYHVLVRHVLQHLEKVA